MGSQQESLINKDISPEALAFATSLTQEDWRLFGEFISGNRDKIQALTFDEQMRAMDIIVGLQLFKDKKAKISDDQRIALYAQHGLAVSVPEGRCSFSRSLMCAEHDGVPYCVDEHDHSFEEEGRIDSLLHGIKHRELIIERHHDKIKQVYDYCVNLDVGDIWILCGGGSQLQAFFGNHTGYLAILYLDMEDINERVNSEYMKVIGNTSYTLSVNWPRNNPLFVNRFEIPGIELVESH
jgi:hypothetical protein